MNLKKVKYIFTVHSPITFFIDYGVIIKENIPQTDVILLAAGYQVPFHIGKVFPAYQDTERGIFRKLLNWNLPKAFDRYIDNATGGRRFTAYIDLMHFYQRMLVTHEKC